MTDLPARLDHLSRRERAALLELLRRKKETADAPAGSRGAWEEVRTAPLSYAQERLWLIDQITPGTAAYNIPGAFRLLGRLDIPALSRAVSEVVRRHTALRTVFLAEAGQPVQRIEPWQSVPYPLIDLSALPDELQDAEVGRRAAAEAQRPFDLTTGPLLRIALLILGPEHHVALYTMHHIVSDGWSMSLFARELGALYAAFAEGRPSPLPELPLQYADFALRQRDPHVQERLFRSLDWWKERLAGLEPLELPTDRPRPPVRSGRGTSRSLLLPAQLMSHLSVLGRRERATLYMVLLALFQTLLHRSTGQDDIAIGSPVANRTGVDQEQLIGFFVNTVVIRTGLGGDPPLLQLLDRVRTTALEAYRHQEAPFERVVEAAQPERQLSRSPLFQVLFSLQSAGTGTMELPGLTLEPVGASTSTAKFDLSLAASELPQGLSVSLSIDVDLYEPATADRMLLHLKNLLVEAVSAPEARLSELPLLDMAERQQLLVEWNRTEMSFPREMPIHRLVEERVDRQPGAVAVSADESADLTYADLDAAANRLAHRLRRLGAGPEVPVLVVVERSPALLVTVLAVLKSGSFFVPFDPAHPRERLAVIAARVGARLAVTQERSLGLLPEGVEAVCVDRDREAIAAEPSVRPDSGAVSENLMYVIFTSGSTGEPKGVAVTHRNAARLLHGNAFAEIGPGETYVVLTAVTFDPSILEVWGTLVHGGRLAVLPPEFPSLDELADFLDRHQVTQMHLTTALFHQMAERRPERLAGLHRLAVGGEAISPALAGRALEAVPGLLMTNCYGPTEVTVISTTQDVTLEDSRRPSMPIGTPVANTAVYVLDRWLQPLPVGVWGELYIGGEGVSRGYFGRPELTAERFVPDHLGSQTGGRLYRSGDRARRRPDGVLDFAGRIDRQVKIRGFRVEPGEIEAAITTHPEVSEAAVLVRGEGSQRWLVAYVVGSEGDIAEHLKRWLAGRLPDPMIPTDFVVLPELPLTPNGKVDRRALEKIAVDRKTEEFIPPRTPVEETLAALWIEVLGTERTGGRVGVHDHFFGLGGHSLLATRLVAALRDTFEVELPLRVLFEWPTLEEIARAVEEAREAKGLAAWAGRRPAELAAGGASEASRSSWEEGGTAPASFAQERLWLLDQLAPGTSTYNIPGAIRLRGALDVPALARAISEIVRRQASLRTVFATENGQPIQRIRPWRPAPLPLIDLSALPEETRDAEVSRRAAAESGRPFDLEEGPLFRVVLLVLGARPSRHHVLLYTLHHIVSDGWSMAVFYGEMAALYEAFSAGRPSPLSELPLQYPDFALRQRGRFGEERLTRALAWWQERLAGVQPLELPTDRPRPPVRSGRGTSRVAEYRSTATAELTALARGERATLYMALLAAFQALLVRFTGQDDIAVGSPVANRAEVDEERMIGFFVNALVMRTDASGDPLFRELLARVRGTVLDSLLRQEVPFEKVVEAVQPERQLGRTPLFQAMFSLQNVQQGVGLETVELPGLTLEWVSAPNLTAKFDLSLAFFERPIGLAARLEIDLDLYEVATAGRMLRQLGALLDGALATPDAHLSELPLLEPAEREQILVEWNRTEVPFPREVPIHRLVEERVDCQPEALAVSADGSADLTYAELDAAANRLAHRLRALGAGPEVSVLVVVERSPVLLVTVLAVLKSGSFFVPFDPAHPRERLAVIAARVGARLAVTQERSLGLLPEGVEAVCVDRDREAIAAEPSVRPDSGAVSENLMYVIFTSGSTGEPKGVAVTHRNAARLLHGNAFAEIGPGETYVVLTAVTFDPSILEVWGTLVHGGRLAVLPPEFPSLDELADFLDRHQVTQMHLTTALFHQMAERRPERLAGLHRLAVGGEAISPALAGRALEAVPGLLMTNCYGPTEVTVISTTRDVTLEDSRRPSMPIGTPVANTAVYVLDRWLQPLPVGVWGELYIGGEGVSRGYFGRPELTAERFVPDHLGSRPGARLYRSGDRARRRPDGVLDLAGRIDRQVKIRGFRVEPEEIEAAITTHPEVREAAVLVRGEGSQRWLVGYVVACVVGSDGDIAEHLKRWLAGRLPDPMIPTDFVVLSGLPLTPNGKVDRRALEKIAPERGAGDAFVAPRTPAEETLAGLWVEVLGTERTGGRVGVHDHFFGLGGHSLLATRLVAAIRDVFGVELPLRVLFEWPTLEEIARAVEEARDAAGLPSWMDLRQVAAGSAPASSQGAWEEGGTAPASFAQERLWLLEQLAPGTATYNMAGAIRLHGGLDVAALDRALSEIVRRHASLRTVFAALDGQPVQRILPWRPRPLPRIDLSGLPDEARTAEEGRRAFAEARRPFDLEAGPLFRAALLVVGPGPSKHHVLLYTLHHIVSDGWSMAVVHAEVAALYEAFSAGRPSPLAELPLQYPEIALRQRSRFGEERLARALAWWQERLAGIQPLELPTDHPRPPVRSGRGASRDAGYRHGVVAELTALARSERATPYMALLALFQTFLVRCTGQDDIAVGSPVANRSEVDEERVIGLFVNPLVMRTDAAGDPPFREMLARVRGTVLDALLRQEVPFEKVVEAVQPERQLGRTPLFQVMFALQNVKQGLGMESIELSGLTLEPVSIPNPTAKLDLSVAFSERPNSLGARLELDLDLYEVVAGDRILRQLGTLLEGALATPDARLSELPLLDPAERAQILGAWNRTETPFPREMPIHRLVEERADRQPGAVAVSADGSADLLYGELDAAASRLANHLRGSGAGPEVPVLVLLERSPALLVALLAVLKSGSFFVPLDPAHPRERLAVIARQAGAHLAVTREGSLGLLPEGVEAVCVDRDAAVVAAEPAVRPDAGTVSENLMYVIFTSGSTGEPKGVAVTHRNAARLLHGNAFAEIGPGEISLQLMAATFDPSILEVWGTLVHGGRLAVLPPEVPGLDELADFLGRHRVTQALLPAALFHQMAEQRPERLAGLHRLTVGGEPLSPALAERVLETAPGLLLTNSYGPTEVTVVAAVRDVTVEDTRRPSLPIGTPVANTAVYVLDRWMQPLPVGVWGELHIGGDGVSRGYIGRPDLTAGSFVPDPLGSAPGSRLYRSGDRARWRPDGVLDFAGRFDRQVKIRGFRVEPGEIEAAIVAHPEAREAAVLVRGEGSERRLVAYVAGSRDEIAGDLRRRLAGRLPDPMLPADFVILPELPRTPNGKVDHRALETIAVERKAEGYVPPRTPVEEALAALWIEVLGAERTGGRVGLRDHFFGLGGHSLLATRLVAAIRDFFRVELPLRTVFERPALEDLAASIAEMGRHGGPADGPVLPVPREPGASRFPVSFSQLREWILDRLEPGNPAYNIPSNLRIEGPLSIPVLRAALNGLVRRHEVFRTSFAAGDGEPLQVVLPELHLKVPVIDLAALSEEARQAELWRRVRRETGTGFDLSAAPLLRARIVRLGPADHALLMTVHHIISDGWSMGILNRELAALYEGITLPPLPVQYADYAVWLRRRLDDEGLERQSGYWRQRLAGAPPLLELPTDRPRPPVRSSRGSRVRVELPQPLTGRLEELARRHGASLFMVLLAGYQALLARWSGQDDVVVGTYSGNRSRRELEGLIGFFINTLVLRSDLSGEPSFADLVGRVRETTLGAFAHQDVPFEKLLEILQLPRDPSRTPLFQALLVLQNFPPARADLSTGVRLTGMAVGSEKSDYDLALWLGEGPDGIAGTFEYSTDLFDEATIERLAAQLRTLLEAAAADPDRNVWALPLIGEEERALQLEAWSRGPAVPEGAALLHRLIEEQALRTPEAVALEAGGVKLAYAELVRRARSEADRLREAGVGPGSIVALAAERSPELIVRMLAVLQAGAAYLPIDPAYPQERRAYMLQDSGALLFPPLPGGSECGWERGPGGGGPGEAGSDAAYVIYTSGSTGRPKGVVVPHHAIAAFVRGARDSYNLGPGDRVLQFASISFDTSAEEIWPALASGATLVLRPEDMASSIPHFVREVERLGITCLDLPTAFWHELTAGMGSEGLAMPPGLRLVILGGEEALADRLALWQRRVGPAVRLVNTYGPTETTIVATRHELAGLAGGVVPIGRPIAGARTWLLDRFFEPVPPGVRGELWIGGSGVARGYLGRPELTAERFVPDPFGGVPGARLYRTGDLAVLRPDGDLVFAGRADRQLKVRGYRIEPGEIESALRRHPSLRDAVVDARGPGDAKRIVAWIVPREGMAAPGASDLRAFLRDLLPEPLLPAAFAPVDALPLTPSGKVDRRSLAEPAGTRPDDGAYVEPQSTLERTIAGVYSDLLRVDRVGLHDNFFDLGGHSLLIVRAHLRLQEALGREIPVVDLFRFPTVAALARHLRGEEASTMQKVQGLAEQQRAAQQRQKAAMERLRRPGRVLRK